MLSEIGSNFWINPEDKFEYIQEFTPQIFGVKGTDFCFLSTCRSAISLAIEMIELRNPGGLKIAVVPSFTCETVIQPFLEFGYSLKPYDINAELGIDKQEFLRFIKQSKASVLIIHRYFGLDTMKDMEGVIQEIRDLGICIIEDRTQCLYSDIKTLNADFFVASMRKWNGIPDGGFLVCKDGRIEGKPLDVDKELELAKIDAGYAKYNYLFKHIGEKRDFLEKFRKAEDILDKQAGRYKISPFSYAMQANFDIGGLKQKRRNNYLTLIYTLSKVKGIEIIFNGLPDEAVPLYFPIMVKRRRDIQRRLCERGIYAPIIWPKSDLLPNVSDNANRLYRDMLCIPIDQRYGEDDMNRIADALTEVNGYGD